MEFKGTRLEKISVSFSIYLLLSLSMVLFAAAETKPFSGSITVRNVNDLWNIEVIRDKYSQDAITVVNLSIVDCQVEISCGGGSCDIPYSEVADDEELPKDEDGEEKNVIPICDYFNADNEHITLVVDPQRWTNIAVKYVSETKLEYYFVDQKKYSITQPTIKGDVRIYQIENAERTKEMLDDITSIEEILCSADLLGEAEIECNEQMMEIYAIVATYWYFITHFWEFILASLQIYLGPCMILSALKNMFGKLFNLLGDKQGKYAGKLAQYANLIAGLVKDAYELYEKYYAYVEAALSCKEAYEYIKDLLDAVMDLVDKIKSYLSFLGNPIPTCLKSLMEKIGKLQDKLMGLIPDFIPDMGDFLDGLDGLYPDCIQNFLAKLGDFKNLLNRFLGIIPSYCSKVQTMKEYYEDPAKGNDPGMASKYAGLYVPCGNGLWSGLSFEDGLLSECTNIEGLDLSNFLPEKCKELYDLDLTLSLGLDIELPSACKDFESILEELLTCDLDFNSYKDKYSDFDEGEAVSC